MKFIMTQSAETASELSKRGYTLVNQEGTTWLFLNNSKLSFSGISGFTFTDKMFI